MSAIIANMSAVVLVSSLLAYLIVVQIPHEGEVASREREASRVWHEKTREEDRQREDLRIKRLWERHTETMRAIADLTAEIKTSRGK